MKQLSSRELEEGLSLLAEGLVLDEVFDGCTILSRDIDWVWSRCCVCVAEFLLDENEVDGKTA